MADIREDYDDDDDDVVIHKMPHLDIICRVCQKLMTFELSYFNLSSRCLHTPCMGPRARRF